MSIFMGNFILVFIHILSYTCSSPPSWKSHKMHRPPQLPPFHSVFDLLLSNSITPIIFPLAKWTFHSLDNVVLVTGSAGAPKYRNVACVVWEREGRGLYLKDKGAFNLRVYCLTSNL